MIPLPAASSIGAPIRTGKTAAPADRAPNGMGGP